MDTYVAGLQKEQRKKGNTITIQVRETRFINFITRVGSSSTTLNSVLKSVDVLRMNQTINSMMFVGDRDYSCGSRIKGFLRYGGRWKPIQHSHQQVLMANRGSFICVNPQYVSVRSAMIAHSRDTVSATAIGLSELSTLIFEETAVLGNIL
ncbi:MAG: hypothetical protein EXX96DRAFT_617484 [Benjaminiella poitrasii]|nr:MAG: hypothetical protein EXX96DRAFT_617484 [Benjaminiella poitrasii]